MEMKASNTQKNRLSSGGHIDREQLVEFVFDGKTYTGFAGDTLASALLANDVVLMGRSFKCHRPRGIVTANLLEPNAWVNVLATEDAENTTAQSAFATVATTLPIEQGLRVESQNRFPSLTFDLHAINRWLSPLFSESFFYHHYLADGLKMWSKHDIRKAENTALEATDHVISSESENVTYHHCEVLVVGGGVSGLTAAQYHVGQGRYVILAEEQSLLGGRLKDSTVSEEQQLCQRLTAALTAHPNVTLLKRTEIIAALDNVFDAVERLKGHSQVCCYHKIVANDVVYATGAVERPMLFKNNDLPNVMLAEALQTHVVQYAVLPGRNVVFYTTNNSVYPLAIYLAKTQQCRVTVVDTRSIYALIMHLAKTPHYRVAAIDDKTHPIFPLEVQEKTPQYHVEIIDTRDNLTEHPTAEPHSGIVEVYLQSKITTATGGQRVRKVSVKSINQQVNLPCDMLAMSGGFSPNVLLQRRLGHSLSEDDSIDAVISHDEQGTTVGSAAGVWDLADKIASAQGLSDEAITTLRKNTIEHDSRTELNNPAGKFFFDF